MDYIKYGHHISYKNILKIFLIYFIIFLPILIFRYPDIRNELKYFLVTDNMIATKEYFILKYCSELYPDKPPLFFWLLTIIKKYCGVYFMPCAVFFGTLLPSFIMVVMSYSLFSKIKDEKSGFLISIFLCTTPFFIGTSLVLRMDMLMSLFIFLALYKFFSIYYGLIKNNFFNIFLMYFYIFLAIFTKGPAGIIVPFGTIFVFLYLENNFAFLKKIHIRRGMFILGIFIVIWVCGIIISPEGKEYILIMLKQEAAGRILKAKTHIKPFYYYLKMLPVLLFPYGIFFIGSLVYYIKNIRAHKNWEPLEKIGFSWVVLPFICFSLASGKLDIYLLPMFVGMYLMIYSFLLKIKDTKAGEILIKISMILSIFPYIFDRFFNKENYFYKKLLYFPITSVMILGLIMPFTKVYNEKFSLQPIKNIVSNKNIDTVAYKFKDFANMQAEIKNNISFAETEDEVKENIKDNEKIYIISRAKYKKNLKDFNLVYENMNYSLFTN